MDTVLHGEENYQKNYHLLRDILVHFCNTFYRCYSKYMRDVNWKSPTTAFCLYNPRRPPVPPSPPLPRHISLLQYTSTIGKAMGLYDINKNS